jgi:cation transport ATPase
VLEPIAGIQRAAVDIPARAVTVTDDEASVDRDRLVEAIEQHGSEVPAPCAEPDDDRHPPARGPSRRRGPGRQRAPDRPGDHGHGRQQTGALPEVVGFQALAGRGARAEAAGTVAAVGRRALMTDAGGAYG